MASRQQRPRRQRACTYCGREEPEETRFTRDHVLPRALFNVMDPQMITVLACPECQREKSYGDDDLRDFVNLHYEGSWHPEAWQQQLKIMQATLGGRSKIGRAFLETGRQRALLSAAGIYLGDVWEAPIPNDNRDMFRTLEFIVRGLYRHDIGQNLPLDCRVSVVHLESTTARQTLAPLTRLPHRGPTIKGHVVAWWVSYHPVEDPQSTLWVMLFNDFVWFLGGTGALARPDHDDGAQGEE